MAKIKSIYASFLSFLLVFSTLVWGLSTNVVYASSSWNSVGSAGFSAGGAAFTSLAIAPDGTPYVAYEDMENGYKATVMKFVNGSWSPVGPAGFSAGGVADTSVVIAPDGTPYVAYADWANRSKATVMKFSPAVTGVTLDKDTLTLTAGGTTGSLTATVAPDNTTNKNVTWSSSNTDVATVDANGVVTPKAAGTATITVTTEDGNNTATCTVTVQAALSNLTINHGTLQPAFSTTQDTYSINVGNDIP